MCTRAFLKGVPGVLEHLKNKIHSKNEIGMKFGNVFLLSLMCVYMYVCMYVCMYIYIYICVCACSVVALKSCA